LSVVWVIWGVIDHACFPQLRAVCGDTICVRVPAIISRLPGKHAAIARIPGSRQSPVRKLIPGRRRVAAEIGEIVRKRAEAEAAIAKRANPTNGCARRSISCAGIVFLDAEGRYILWNKKYAEIYNRSSDCSNRRAAAGHHSRRCRTRRLPGAIGREEEWDRRAADKNSISPANAMNRRWPTAASS